MKLYDISKENVLIYRMQDIVDKPISGWWTVAALRTRGTFSEDNPLVSRVNQVVSTMKKELQAQGNARVEDKKQFRRSIGR